MSRAKPVNLDPRDVSSAREYIMGRVKAVESGCWEWQQNKLHGGHGQGKWRRYPIKAHRLAYAAFVGEPGELNVLHKCDNPCCCNPAHFFLGTKGDNNRDAAAKGRYAKRANKLTREQYNEIVERLKTGEAQIPLAHSMGIDAFVVNQISTGTHWSCAEYGQGLGTKVHDDGRAAFKLSAHNSSGFRGVVKAPTPGRWIAQAIVRGKAHYFGTHATPEAAAEARARGLAQLLETKPQEAAE